MEDLVKELTIDMVPDGDNRIIAETIGVENYANEGARTKIDELKKVKFSKRSNKAAQGDKSLTVDVDMMIVGGVYQDGVAPVYGAISRNRQARRILQQRRGAGKTYKAVA